MKPSLVMKMGQQLTMTPQLQQAIKLLQLSTLDLHQEVQHALESNPMLELESEGLERDNQNNNDEAAFDIPETPPNAPVDASAATTATTQETTTEPQPDSEWADKIPDELPVDTAWDDIYQPATSSSISEDREFDITARTGGQQSLRDHLEWQLNLIPLSEKDNLIGIAIIDDIDSRGYLASAVEQLAESFDPSLEIEPEEIEAVLKLVQQFDPPGIGGRDLQECLTLQLRQLPDDEPFKDIALTVTEKYLSLLGGRDYKQLLRKLRISEADLGAAVRLIQTLNPKPGTSIESDEPEYIIPDVVVKKQKEGFWTVELNGEAMPRLRINNDYASLIKRADSSRDNTYMKNQLQEARWLLKSLQSRNETLMKVATCIVEQQQAFLDYGEEAMKPMVLHDIAEAVGMHESTISRVTTQKYMHTPRGIFELKYFFSSHVSTSSGGECSSTAIRAIIKKLVAAENPKKPLSDNKIATLLSEQGIKVARRTIAKYRESMNIPPSNERKRLMP
ncbi:RNA polymerase factor sigma-54 [Endozoicomonadaceae bacterium StTr2]